MNVLMFLRRCQPESKEIEDEIINVKEIFAEISLTLHNFIFFSLTAYPEGCTGYSPVLSLVDLKV